MGTWDVYIWGCLYSFDTGRLTSVLPRMPGHHCSNDQSTFSVSCSKKYSSWLYSALLSLLRTYFIISDNTNLLRKANLYEPDINFDVRIVYVTFAYFRVIIFILRPSCQDLRIAANTTFVHPCQASRDKNVLFTVLALNL